MKTLRNIAIAALLLIVVAPCSYNQYFRARPAEPTTDGLLNIARAVADSPLSDAVVVEGIRERAVCAKMDGQAVVYREDSKTLTVDDGRPIMAAALDGWCRDKLGADWSGRDLP